MQSNDHLLPNEVTRPMFPWRPAKGLVSYGCAFTELLHANLTRMRKERVFVVVSKSLAENTNELNRLKECLGTKLVGVKIGFPSHPPFEDVLKLSGDIQRADADAVVTLGGGSIIDAVKLVAFSIANGVHDFDSLEGLSKATAYTMETENDFANYTDCLDIKPAALTKISIPTTLSAGEYSPYAGAVDPRDGVKKLFVHQSLVCEVVILDPDLTKTVPEWVWMSSGVRSIDHCVELLSSLRQHETQTEESAKKGLVMVARGLLKLRLNPQDVESRLETQIGSNYAMDGISLQIILLFIDGLFRTT
ncbi:Fe-containing alcohol dehydrogenase [Talaromyces pinophilus]|uniref:Fe-containing alcohol dehydrogenase n=1 Tax=Talaromyces pinophilus TaxID=128442 RepID=A0A6V8H1F3_TALPI|nr:Alcohol dehydrogenase, iron-type [Penicillium occitanis (nom. inval.)]PCG97394.1 hypothetical protein PENOC_068120 [Penicillium occitanis (nom. inval.)]GAM35137.1 Fe-containing alcohol dehydrogenase [Talaromyces pinophilus]